MVRDSLRLRRASAWWRTVSNSFWFEDACIYDRGEEEKGEKKGEGDREEGVGEERREGSKGKRGEGREMAKSDDDDVKWWRNSEWRAEISETDWIIREMICSRVNEEEKDTRTASTTISPIDFKMRQSTFTARVS